MSEFKVLMSYNDYKVYVCSRVVSCSRCNAIIRPGEYVGSYHPKEKIADRDRGIWCLTCDERSIDGPTSYVLEMYKKRKKRQEKLDSIKASSSLS